MRGGGWRRVPLHGINTPHLSTPISHQNLFYTTNLMPLTAL